MMPQLLIAIGVYSLLVMGGGLALYGWLQVRSFLQAHESISSQSEFFEFKRVVKSNMLLALAIMMVVSLILLLGIAGLYAGAFGWLDLLVIFVFLGPACSFAGVKLTAAEMRMKAMPLDNETLRPWNYIWARH